MDRRAFLSLPVAAGVHVTQPDPRLDSAERLSKRAILRGLSKVGVSVNVLGDCADWVNVGRLQTRSELTLRQLGVPVASGVITPEPTLMLIAYSLLVGRGSKDAMVTMMAHVLEPVRVVRQSTGPFVTTTWGGEPLMLSTTREAADRHIQEAVAELCELFANDYLAGNLV